MHAPVSWLRELADVPADAKGVDIAAALVRVGLEEEGLHGGDIAGPLVVGRVLTVQPEPQKNGKTINWCTVDVGDHGQKVTEGKAQEIVCGAHNFAPGDLVVTVLPGGVLPGGFEISARKTYGHVSNGMICSAAELGLGEDHDGIIVLTELLGEEAAAGLQPGDDAIALLGLGDEVVEVNVTPDRGYCFSLRGIAREYALSTGREFRDPARLEVASANGDGYAVSLADERPLDGRSGCDRYVARVVRGVDTTATSPAWMQKRLTQVGMRPISLAVDVTNYVMMLLGQPLHAFDLDTLSGSIGTRRARAGEKLTTLDDVERALDPEDLLIVDGSDTPLAIAGVMGGESSEVSDSTTNVLIESAHFDAVTVARSSRRHKLTTEASKRFERGVDPAVASAAAQLAVDLLVKHGGGTADAGVTDVDNRIEREAFDFDVTLPTRYIGLDYSRDEVLTTLRAIGCEVEERDGDVVSVAAATWRPDLTDGPELVEEVARVRGYDQIPSVLPQPKSAGRGLTHGQRARRTIANTLAHQGLVEVLTYPFIGEGRFDQLGYRRRRCSPLDGAHRQPAVRRGPAHADLHPRHPARCPASQRLSWFARRRGLRSGPRDRRLVVADVGTGSACGRTPGRRDPGADSRSRARTASACRVRRGGRHRTRWSVGSRAPGRGCGRRRLGAGSRPRPGARVVRCCGS